MTETNTNPNPTDPDQEEESPFNGQLLLRLMGGMILIMLLIGVGILLFA